MACTDNLKFLHKTRQGMLASRLLPGIENRIKHILHNADSLGQDITHRPYDTTSINGLCFQYIQGGKCQHIKEVGP
jgi:hypothetical protein